jgi:predicted MFS family arabinose efflux permease
MGAARARVLSWALIGQAAAWIVGMPLFGVVSEASWRYAWLVLPLAAADRRVARWALGELLANSAWAGTLVYAGALFTESYRTSLVLTGVVLAGIAAAYVAGNLLFRRFVGGDSRSLLVRLALLLAVGIMLFGAVRPGLVVSAVLLAVPAFLAGGRTLIGNAFGLEEAPERRLAVMAARAAANQFGYLFGAAAAGAALAVSGYAALGIVLGALFVGAAAALARRPSACSLRHRLIGPAPLTSCPGGSS